LKQNKTVELLLCYVFIFYFFLLFRNPSLDLAKDNWHNKMSAAKLNVIIQNDPYKNEKIVFYI